MTSRSIPTFVDDQAASLVDSITDKNKNPALFRTLFARFIGKHLKLTMKREHLDEVDAIHIYLMWDNTIISDVVFLTTTLV